MSSSEVARRRIEAQHLEVTDLRRPRDVVAWLGAVQAQDYLGALWAVGVRLAPAAQATEALIEAALADRSIVRSWPMRGTLHFVAAEDLRWLLALLGPRLVARAARRHAELDLDAATFTRSRALLEKALEGGRCLTRAELYRVLSHGKVSPAGQRGIHILQRLALDGVLCFGARQGKQQTFALVDEWLAPGLASTDSKARSRDESLFELARRYFTGHGPATLADFTWWTGLPAAEAKAYVARFDRRYAGVRAFQDEQLRLAKARGYVETIAGRRWPIGGLESLDAQVRSYAERLARRATHEGSVADISRRALLEVDRALRREGLATVPLVQMLDEVIFEVPEGELARAAALCARAMQGAFQLEVPLVVDVEVGPTWADLTAYPRAPAAATH